MLHKFYTIEYSISSTPNHPNKTIDVTNFALQMVNLELAQFPVTARGAFLLTFSCYFRGW